MLFISRNKYLFLVSLATLLVGLIFYSYNKSKDPLPGKLELLLRSCSPSKDVQSDSLDYGCLKIGLESLVKSQDLGEIMSSLEKVFAEEEGSRPFGTLTCHGPAHYLGEVAYKEGVSLSGIFNACSRNCDYGCIHGAFLEMIKETPDFFSGFISACDQFKNADVKKDLTSCYHILGHGITDLLGRDLSKAVLNCDKLEEEYGKLTCVQGVLMEVILGTNETSKPLDIEKNDLVDFCGKVNRKYSYLCYEMVGYYGYTLMENKDYAAGACLRVPTNNQEGCFTNLGNRAYFAYRGSTDEIRNYCATLGEFRRPCILGAVEADVDFDPDLKNAIGICNREDIFTKDCFSLLGERIQHAYGFPKREGTCSLFSEPERSYCLDNDDEN